MPTEIYLVKVGMNMTEGVVDEWYIPDGSTVEVGEMLYRLETEKVNLDVDAEAEGYDLTIDNGRIISATPINNVKTMKLPKITVKSSTGSGAIIKPILGRLPLTPQGEVLQIIDCVK